MPVSVTPTPLATSLPWPRRLNPQFNLTLARSQATKKALQVANEKSVLSGRGKVTSVDSP